jgi:RNA polymerase sigma factor (sigma-70 family)
LEADLPEKGGVGARRRPSAQERSGRCVQTLSRGGGKLKWGAGYDPNRSDEPLGGPRAGGNWPGGRRASSSPVDYSRKSVRSISHEQDRTDFGKRLSPDLRQQVPIEELNAQMPLIASEPTPEEILETQQRLDRIRAVLEALSLRTREIYFAHRAGYSYAEIADHMNISRTTIRRHIARALLAIMEHGES